MISMCAINQKGGAGKSLLILCLLMVAWSRKRMNAMLIDVDPQRSAEKWSTAREAREGMVRPIVVDAVAENLKVLLREAEERKFDLVLIDTPGRIDKAMIFAAAASDVLLIPTKTAKADLDSLAETLETLDSMRMLDKAVVIVNAPRSKAKTERAAADDQAVRALVVERFGCTLAPVPLGNMPELSYALDTGQSISEIAPKSAAGKTVEKLFDWVIAHAGDRRAPVKGAVA